MDGLLIAVDPGMKKCGFAVMDGSGRTLEKGIVDVSEFAVLLKGVKNRHADIRVAAVGGGTGSGPVIGAIREAFGDGAEVVVVKETDTTLVARRKYFEENRPRGLLRLLPAGLRVPPGPVDDFAAVAIGEIFLNAKRV